MGPPAHSFYTPVPSIEKQPLMNQPPFIPYQQQPAKQGNQGIGSILMASNAVGDIDLTSSNAAYTLEKLKQDEWYYHQNNFPQQVLYQPNVEGEEEENDSERIFINRDIPERFLKISKNESDIRNDVEKKFDEKTDLLIEEEEFKIADLSKKLKFPVNEQNYGSDLIFSNGNNREKRRNELFEKYSDLYRFKEENRINLFLKEKLQIENKLKDLSQTNDEDIKNFETIEQFKDLTEYRDYELIKVKLMRNYRRNENLKNYYSETSKIYENVFNQLNLKLESLKNYLTKQKNLLVNLDRDFTEISSSRSNKFYSGFNEDEVKLNYNESDNDSQENEHIEINNNESSETDTGGNSSSTYKKLNKKNKVTKVDKNNNNNQLLSSILSGFAPLLTDKEFEIITSEDFKSRYKGSNTNKDAENDEFSSGSTNTKKRGPRIRNTDKDTTIMNKIMKGYTAPDNLKPDEIEEDLILFKSMIQK